MVSSGDITFFSAVLFKISLLILALVLGLQLIRSSLPFPYDIQALFSFEQFIFIFAVLIVTILSFIEGLTLQKRDSLNFGVVVLYIISAIGTYFSVIIFLGYNFDNSTTNTYIGYYLLVGVLLILVNAREQLGKLISKK